MLELRHFEEFVLDLDNNPHQKIIVLFALTHMMSMVNLYSHWCGDTKDG